MTQSPRSEDGTPSEGRSPFNSHADAVLRLIDSDLRSYLQKPVRPPTPLYVSPCDLVADDLISTPYGHLEAPTGTPVPQSGIRDVPTVVARLRLVKRSA